MCKVLQLQWAPHQLVSIISVSYELHGVLRRQGSQVRAERDIVAREAEERSDDEAAKPPSNPVGAALAHPCASRHLWARRKCPWGASCTSRAIFPWVRSGQMINRSSAFPCIKVPVWEKFACSHRGRMITYINEGYRKIQTA